MNSSYLCVSIGIESPGDILAHPAKPEFILGYPAVMAAKITMG
jgi:hypothetical protein